MKMTHRLLGFAGAGLLAACLVCPGCAPRQSAPPAPAPIPAPVPAPAAPVMVAEVTAEPAPAQIRFKGQDVGVTPVSVSLAHLDEVTQLTASLADQPLMETRIRFSDPDRVQIAYRFGGEPSPMAKALGLARVLVFDYGDQATFDVDSADLKPEVRPLLERQAGLLNSHFPTLDVFVCGHTDSSGGEAHNLELSLKRAQAVGLFLGDQSVGKTRIKIQGFGEGYPVGANDTPEGRARNRRTEIVLPQ